jgi:hypothetical protein
MKSITAFELTQALRVTPDQVAGLLERGEIAYFMVDGEVRVLEDEVWRFIRESSEKASRATAGNVLMGNQVWRNLMADDPSLAATVRALETTPGTFGDKLKRAVD